VGRYRTCIPNIIRVTYRGGKGWGGAYGTYGKRIDAYKSWVRNPGRKSPLGRPRHWVGRLYRNISQIGWEGVDWIDPAQDGVTWLAFVNAVMNVRVP